MGGRAGRLSRRAQPRGVETVGADASLLQDPRGGQAVPARLLIGGGQRDPDQHQRVVGQPCADPSRIPVKSVEPEPP